MRDKTEYALKIESEEVIKGLEVADEDDKEIILAYLKGILEGANIRRKKEMEKAG